MKTQRRLRLRGIGKHSGGNVWEWTIRHHVRNNLARAFERNCHPKHYDTGLQMPCYTMDYITGVTTWHGFGYMYNPAAQQLAVLQPHAFMDMALADITLTRSETP